VLVVLVEFKKQAVGELLDVEGVPVQTENDVWKEPSSIFHLSKVNISEVAYLEDELEAFEGLTVVGRGKLLLHLLITRSMSLTFFEVLLLLHSLQPIDCYISYGGCRR